MPSQQRASQHAVIRWTHANRQVTVKDNSRVFRALPSTSIHQSKLSEVSPQSALQTVACKGLFDVKNKRVVSRLGDDVVLQRQRRPCLRCHQAGSSPHGNLYL